MNLISLAKSAFITLLLVTAVLCFMYNLQGRVEEAGNVTAQQNPLSLERRLPNAIIIGVRKAGTRALLEFLNLHPHIKISGPECHFFDKDENYVKGFQWYRQRMRPSFPDDVTMEKTPAYFVTDYVPARINEMLPTAKLLVIVRDPTTRAISDYTQIAEHPHSKKLAPFERYVTTSTGSGINEKSGYVTKGLYVNHLRNWIRYFPLRQIHFVSGEKLVENPAAEMKAVENFLNIRHLITKEAFYVNESKGFPCAKKDGESGCLGAGKGRKHPTVREDVVQMLRNFYRPYNEELYKLVGRNFSWAWFSLRSDWLALWNIYVLRRDI